MFIKKLTISNKNGVIREIKFSSGLNLIIDDTPASDIKMTGNNVGKTTVLKLVDFCLGGSASIIYADTENKKESYRLVKDYLIDYEVVITLVLKENLNDDNSREIVIKRNFLSRKKALRTINGTSFSDKDFEDGLLKAVMPHHNLIKPTFRQIISHNIRYRDENINNTLKTLNKYTSDSEYETLYLFLLGCSFNDGAKRQALLVKIKQEEAFRERLENKQTKTAYEIALSMVEDEISSLNKKKDVFDLNADFEKDMDKINEIRYKMNKISSSVSKMRIRQTLIQDSITQMEQNFSSVDIKQLENLYSEASENMSGINKTFSELVDYHNEMLVEKIKFLAKDLPALNERIKREEKALSGLIKEEKELSKRIAKGDLFKELEEIIAGLNERYRKKGEYESIISQINNAENNIKDLMKEINATEDVLFSDDFEKLLKNRIKLFNKHFTAISEELYGEKYALKYDKVINKNKQKIYKFSSFNANLSSGKKQGEILCFDLAYILFADEENIPCMHFLLNDKKELMHDNQLIKITEFVQNKNIQLVLSILKDKLPENISGTTNIAVELSQESKLFKIEECIDL